MERISAFAHSHPWIVLGIGVFLAFVVGVAAGGEVESEPAEDDTRVQEEARLDALAADLEAREQELDDIEQLRDELEAREQELEQAEREFAQRVRRSERNLIEQGMWEVGEDIRPGTYRSPEGENCYWARKTDATGDFGTIITNGGGLNQTVTISRGEWFDTNCGSWERL